MKRHWTIQEDERLKFLIDENKNSLSNISRMMNIHIKPIRTRIKNLNLKYRYTNQYRKYFVDVDFWKYPNQLNSFYAGFIAADGCIYQISNNCYKLRIELAEKDIYILHEFKKDTNFTGHIYRRDHKKNNKNGQPIISNNIEICCPTQWVADLENKFSIIQNKTKRLNPPPIIDNNDFLSFCYILGYISGDGNIHLKSNGKTISISVVSSSYSIINWIHNKINKIFTVKSNNNNRRANNILFNKKSNVYCISFSTIISSQIIKLSQSINFPKITRKWNNPDVFNFVDNIYKKYSHILDIPLKNIKTSLLSQTTVTENSSLISV